LRQQYQPRLLLGGRQIGDKLLAIGLFPFCPGRAGQAYEYLIKKFANATNKKTGKSYTPRNVVQLMMDILDPQPGETIYDLVCGRGGWRRWRSGIFAHW